MSVSAQMVKELRQMTGAGMMDCKKALAEVDGNMEAAVEFLRKKGLSKVAKKAGRVAAEGLVTSYIHGNGRIGVLVEVNSETDFVARNDEFIQFCKDIAMHIAASEPLYVSSEEIDAERIEKEKKFLTEQALEEGKPADVVEKMITGRLNKWKKEICLLDQPFVKDTEKTVGELLTEKTATIGEKIVIRRFVRYLLGEGIEKKQEDFAAEVAATAAGK